MFKKAEKKNLKLKIALLGKSGSGKSYSALTIAKSLGQKICVIDTEASACCVYADKFDFDYHVIEPPYTCEKHIYVMQEAIKQGYDVLIIDSFSPCWDGEGGTLEMADDIAKETNSKNISNWKIPKAEYRKIKNAIFNSDVPIIVTMLSKENVISKDPHDPVAEKHIEKDFTIAFILEDEGKVIGFKKNRTGLFKSGSFLITEETGKKLKKWVGDSFEVSEKEIKHVKQLLEESGWFPEAFKEHLQNKYQVSFKQLNKDQYEETVIFLKDQINLKKIVEKENESEE